jgi:rhodanese-related sulfurtransferase
MPSRSTGSLVIFARTARDPGVVDLPDPRQAPGSQFDLRRSGRPRDHEIVAYCRGPYGVLSFEAVAALRAHGVRVCRFEKGFPEWKAAGLTIEAA